MVSEVVENDIFLANALKRGYANLSQVARMIRPIVRDRLNSEVTEQAILSALKRKRASLPRAENRIMNVLAHSNLSLYGGVVKVVLGTESALQILGDILSGNKIYNIYVTTSPNYVTVIAEAQVIGEFRKDLERKAVHIAEDLSLIVIRGPEELIETEGFLAYLYEKLAMAGVNIEEATNSYTDTLVLLKASQAPRAFQALSDLMENARIRRFD
ncbi:hypothetical protein GCM10007108_12160 [Thermogymnomonas acidicola]|uniref:ACT domain-containing protein n=2 Tax=Thermogymnomonas acidicola TaxID=399579 RepID=A0AA37BRR6_9ARCH|nr:hypothetical protein GCM10007108_12160 [Thermogymnomonas acidicola]